MISNELVLKCGGFSLLWGGTKHNEQNRLDIFLTSCSLTGTSWEGIVYYFTFTTLDQELYQAVYGSILSLVQILFPLFWLW